MGGDPAGKSGAQKCAVSLKRRKSKLRWRVIRICSKRRAISKLLTVPPTFWLMA